MFATHKGLEPYKDFFTWEGIPEMFKLRKNRILEYVYLAPTMVYLRIASTG